MTLCSLYLLLSLAVIQEDTLESGPLPGKALGPIPASIPWGKNEGQEVDVKERLGDAPGAILFIHELTRNVAPLIRGLDRLTGKYEILGFRSSILFMSDDRSAAETRLKAVNRSLKLDAPILYSLSGSDGPGDYGLNRRATLTLVFCREGQVVRSLGLLDVGERDVPMVEEQIIGLTGPLPEDIETLRGLIANGLPRDTEALRELAIDQSLKIRELQDRLARRAASGRGGRGARMQRTEGSRPQNRRNESTNRAPRRGGTPTQAKGEAPRDPELRSLFTSFLRKDLAEEDVKKTYQKIVERGKRTPDLAKEVHALFLLIVSSPSDYGSEPARDLARIHLDKNKKRSPEEEKRPER